MKIMKLWAVVLCISFIMFFVGATSGLIGTFTLGNEHMLTLFIGFHFGGLLTAVGALR